jgi:serine/threonine-protein kinase
VTRVPHEPIPPDWERLEPLLDRVLDAPPSERATIITAVSGGDPALEAALAGLAAEAERGLPILDQPADARFASLVEREPARFPRGLDDRYALIRELGRGGMATVFLARDRKHGREVAVKVMRPELTATLGRERFLREINIAAQLRHPAIVPLFDSGESDGALYYVMPYEAGHSLRERLAREGRLPVSDALGLLRGVCEALGFAHRHGVVHRDLKPENVLLAGRHALLADFGVASAMWGADDAVVTEEGLLGTPAYMAPERMIAAGADPRGDVYALGVMAYEMLSGERPSGLTSLPGRGISAGESVRDELLRLRPDLPAEVATVVGGCLAPRPEDRYPDAGAVLAALEPAALMPAAPAADQTRRRVAMGIAAAATLAALAAALAWRGRSAPAGDPDLVATAPFQVLHPSLQLWREGMVDVLARDLDGAGPLRTVPAAVALRASTGGADRSAAAALGQRTGAGLVVFGSVVRLERDSVALRASVLDRATNQLAADLEVRGPEASMGRLVDSLVVEILRGVGRERPIAGTRRVSITVGSLPAVREFLRGEQFFRRGSYDSALAHYDQALGHAPAFPLALRRMYQAIAWDAPSAARYRPWQEYRQLAARSNRGLAPRDSLIFLADSLRFSAALAADPATIIRDQRRALAVLEEAARRYADDVEIWYELGEVYVHDSPPFGQRAVPAMAALDRAIAADPGFSTAYEHAIGLAIQLGRPRDASRYARAAAALGPGPRGDVMRLAAEVLDSGVGAATVARAVDTASSISLLGLASHLLWHADSGEAVVVAVREILRRPREEGPGPPMVTDSLVAARNLARTLAFRGHLTAAAGLAGAPLGPGRPLLAVVDPFQELALLGAVPDSVAERAFQGGLSPGVDWGGPPFPLLPGVLRGARWWLARGDTVALARLAARAAEVARGGGSPVAELRGHYLEAVAGAYLTLARGDSGAAAGMLRAIPDTLCAVVPCFQEKLSLARLLAARGEDQAAADLLDRWFLMWEATPSSVLAALERARLAERLGDRRKAEDRYRFVSEVWRAADPSLQRHVTEAKEGIARVRRADG